MIKNKEELMKRLLVFAGILLFTACSANISESGFDGIWEGAGIQDDNSSWTIKVTIVGDQYSIDYPSLSCGGQLVLLSSNSNEMEFKEKLTYGKSNCIDNGKTVIVKAGNNSAQFLWYYPDGRKGATGTLTRKKSR